MLERDPKPRYERRRDSFLKIKSRDDALKAPTTPKSRLTRKFEQQLLQLERCSVEELLAFLISEDSEIMVSPEQIPLLMTLQLLQKGKISSDFTKFIGDPLGSDFQFRKAARRSKNTTPFPQRFHGRVFLTSKAIIIVIEVEIDPKDTGTALVHLVEGQGFLPKPKHHVIRLVRKLRN